MNRNANSRFATNPTNIDLSRSRFDMSYDVKTTFNVGDLIPVGRPIEVLPGDTLSVDTSKVVRLQTLLTPMMDNLYLDTYWFFVPNRIVWKHWKQFMGENTQSAWLPTTTYSIPQVTPASGHIWSVGSVADYMGVPINSSQQYLSINALPFRGYALICNEWFRSENLSDPLVIDDGDSTLYYKSTDTDLKQPAEGGTPYKVCKYFDYFTACLPAPQKGPDVSVPVTGGVGNQLLPVMTGVQSHTVNGVPFKAKGPIGSSSLDFQLGMGANTLPTSIKGEAQATYPFEPVNLWADFSGANALATSVNSLRLAFQIQKLYEKDARGGTRYIEILKSHFGVTSPDSRLQRPEYLGGNRIPLHINQVINTAESSGSSLGNVGGQSMTVDVHSDFTHSFTEHGFVFCLVCARYDHTYQQGLHRLWSRRDRLDYYWPVLANIGEQAVLKKEICYDDSSSDSQVFGYQEAWAEYRYSPSIVTGEMRSGFSNSLDSWHLADDYLSVPSLSDAWIREDKSNVDRVLAVTSSVSNQLFGDFYIKCSATRCMPMYSIPGLIDHH